MKRLIIIGVITNIQNSVDPTKYDMAAYAAMKPVQDLGMLGAEMIGLAQPQSHANVLAFLVSDLSSEISGSIIPVDHGWSTI